MEEITLLVASSEQNVHRTPRDLWRGLVSKLEEEPVRRRSGGGARRARVQMSVVLRVLVDVDVGRKDLGQVDLHYVIFFLLYLL